VTRPALPGPLVPLAAGAALGCTEFSLRGDQEPARPQVEVTETFAQAPLPRVDVLWVIDDTPSMAGARAALQLGLVGFLDALDAADLAWQVGVTTTDLHRELPGMLVGDHWILTPGMDGAEAALIATLSLPTGQEPTGGLGAAALAIGPELAAGANRGFRRDDAALHVIVVSDSDDQSEAVLGDDPVGAYRERMSDEADRTGRSALLSAIVGEPEVGCAGPSGTALPGDRYAQLARELGGALGSVCDADLSPVLSRLIDVSAEWPTRFPLQARPRPDSARVWVSGDRVDAGWSLDLDEPALVFDAPPAPGAEIGIRYEVEEDG
jgi:hypothetical protein